VAISPLGAWRLFQPGVPHAALQRSRLPKVPVARARQSSRLSPVHGIRLRHGAIRVNARRSSLKATVEGD
jgi:hypothetical protein